MKGLTFKSAEKKLVMPLISWDIYSQFALFNDIDDNVKDNEMQQLLYLLHRLKIDKNITSNILNNNSYEALVLTNKSKEILWVNEGFTEMTGYSKNYAISKTPAFLQGKKTSEEKRQKIREKLRENRPFKEILINYKKDGTPYRCEVHIFPLVNAHDTYYLALETAV